MRGSMLLRYLVTIIFLTVLSARGAAQSVDAEIDTDVDIYTNQVEAECYIRVGDDEPYIAFNGDCRLYKDNVVVAIDPHQGHPIPYPRSEDWSDYFNAIDWYVPPVSGSVYCGSFGWAEGGPGGPLWVILGHATNSSENFYMPESKTCKSHSPPQNLAVVWGGFSCHECDCTEYDVYHYASGATLYTMQQSFSPVGPWINNGATSFVYSYPHISAGGRWMRVKASNSAGSVYSSAHWAAGACDYCGEPGGGAEP